ncbi:MAG: hypothetical protein WBJ10_12055 [Daejeonella sp.]|uniref:hypothetical protein n=1 Tax=Daejeonella sp. TaxID=2805397 RepID=UPI003C768084
MSENEEILLELRKVNKNLKKLRKALKSRPSMHGPNFNPADWGLKEEVMKILSISKSTLYRYRDDDKVIWDQKKGTSYYHLPSLHKLKDKCMK